VMQPECMVVVTCWVISIAFFSTKSMWQFDMWPVMSTCKCRQSHPYH
jgi:hypothetical protein